MESKRGLSKIALVIIILVILIIIAVGIFAAVYLLQSDPTPTDQIQLYDDYVEGEGFVADEDLTGETMTELASGLTEYRSDELGVRFGYLTGMTTPVDEETEDGTYISTMENESNGTVVELRVGKIDTSQSDIDHIEKQKEALTQELIKAETYTIEVEEDGEIVEQTIVPTADEVSSISIAYAIFGDQLAVEFSYTENGKQATRILTIKNEYVYSLTYKAESDYYKSSDEEKVFDSFEFISKIDEIEASELNTVTIDGVEYTLPIKQTKMSGLNIDSKYATQKIQPNYYTIVSLYDTTQSPKYSAYVYNAKGSVNSIGSCYVTAISTDVNRGGDLVIYKGIELGTTLSEVQELLGSPSKQYSSSDNTLTNIYYIEDVTIQLKFRNDDYSTPDDSSKVVSILLKVAR